MAAPRSLRESLRYNQQRSTINSNTRLMDDLLFGITWVIARDPYLGRKTDRDGVWAIPVDPSPFAPGLVIYYTFNDSYIDLLSIREVKNE